MGFWKEASFFSLVNRRLIHGPWHQWSPPLRKGDGEKWKTKKKRYERRKRKKKLATKKLHIELWLTHLFQKCVTSFERWTLIDNEGGMIFYFTFLIIAVIINLKFRFFFATLQKYLESFNKAMTVRGILLTAVNDTMWHTMAQNDTQWYRRNLTTLLSRKNGFEFRGVNYSEKSRTCTHLQRKTNRKSQRISYSQTKKSHNIPNPVRPSNESPYR